MPRMNVIIDEKNRKLLEQYNKEYNLSFSRIINILIKENLKEGKPLPLFDYAQKK